MKYVIYVLLVVALISVPVFASELDSTDPAPTVADDVITNIPDELPVPLLISGDLSGGYYFVCDTSLGNQMKFYVPIEWAHDVFAVDSSGALVNMSTDTCYLYCPELSTYTFSASRFGTFTFRATNYNTTDLEITNITDTNIEFMQDESVHISDSNVLLGILCVLFLFFGFYIIRRR